MSINYWMVNKSSYTCLVDIKVGIHKEVMLGIQTTKLYIFHIFTVAREGLSEAPRTFSSVSSSEKMKC